MNAWIESLAELMKVGHFGLDSSLLNARYLLPDAKTWSIVVMFAAFCAFTIWDHTHAQDEHDHKSGLQSK
jgi:hypothetical protein